LGSRVTRLRWLWLQGARLDGAAGLGVKVQGLAGGGGFGAECAGGLGFCVLGSRVQVPQD
jgi:hypothetical protein